MHWGAWLSTAAAGLLLSGCLSTYSSETPRTPSRSSNPPSVSEHVVEPGDTLYKIAFRYGLDHRDLARWNRLDNPDLIFVGQRVRLSPPAGVARAAARPDAASPPPAAAQPAARPASLPEPPRQPAPAWQWPAEGQVVSLFGSRDGGLASGISINGRQGQPVLAAAPGRVMYAGTGLIGYGELVIIMHNDTYLSAYGYNARLLVGQGDEVQRGQPIAEMGTGPERQPRLHFEIRRNGIPVDPLPYLPAAR